MEASAKTGFNIDNCFTLITNAIIKNINNGFLDIVDVNLYISFISFLKTSGIK